MANVGFVGLGVMGQPMARNVMAGGHAVRGYDVSEEARATLSANGGKAVDSAAEAADGADFLISMLPNGRIVKEVFTATPAVTEALSADALHIDMSTIHPFECDSVRAHLEEKGLQSMDAPVGRTSANAIDGTLLIMAGGTPAQIEKARAVLMCMGDTLVDCGGPGMGMRMKIINNLMSTALNALTAEALALGEVLNLDRQIAIEVMSGTAAGLGHMQTTYPAKVLKNDLTAAFMMDLARKDLNIALDIGERTGVVQSMAATALQLYDEAHDANRGQQDWTALFAMLREKYFHKKEI